jgi:hypothetical protein
MELLRTDGYPKVELTVKSASTKSIRDGRHKLTYRESVLGKHCLHYEMFADASSDTVLEARALVEDTLTKLVAKALQLRIGNFPQVEDDILIAYGTAQTDQPYPEFLARKKQELYHKYTKAVSYVLPKELVG